MKVIIEKDVHRGGNKVVLVQMTDCEALRTIISLSSQLANYHKYDRYETFTEDQTYFSISLEDRHE